MKKTYLCFYNKFTYYNISKNNSYIIIIVINNLLKKFFTINVQNYNYYTWFYTNYYNNNMIIWVFLFNNYTLKSFIYF